jgi:DNA recombination protein RmuC
MLLFLDVDLNIILIIILIVLVVAILVKKPKTNDELLEYLKTTNNRLNEQGKNFNERLDNAARIISQVQRNIGEFSEIGRGIKSLQEFLQSPKLRGGLGEEVLKEMIGQTFPKNAFHLQYPFKSGVKVDAVLKTEAGLLCIDSKFPMENFKKMVENRSFKKDFTVDVKKHIDDIAKKYILPEEGTMDFALMYIPSEAVYYEVANIPELQDYARKQRVYPVSPNTLYAHLQVLLLSFEGKELEEKSREVFRILRGMQQDYGKVEENLNTLQKHLTNAYNMIGNVFTSFSSLGRKISSTQRLGSGIKEK